MPDPSQLPGAFFVAWLYWTGSLVAWWYATRAYLRGYQAAGNILPPLPARSRVERALRDVFPWPMGGDYLFDRPAARARDSAIREALRSRQADARLESLRRRANRLRWAWVGTLIVYVVAAAIELLAAQ